MNQIDGFGEAFEALIENLIDEAAPLRAALLYRLSEPTQEDLEKLGAVWGSVPLERRRLLLSRMVEASETAYDFNFSTVAHFALDDEDYQVRQSAVEALWEDEQPTTMRRLLRILELDASAPVRAAAATSLGRFILAGELGTLAKRLQNDVEEALLEICLAGDEELEVLCRALESMAYSEREEVAELIKEALTHDHVKMQASAIFAMGRNADERWGMDILRALKHPVPEIRFEASRAAGELMLADAVPILIRFLEDPDREIKHAAIWSLGEIGGRAAQQALFELSKNETDDDILETIEDAMNMAALGSGKFVTYVFTDPEHEDFDDSDIDPDPFMFEDDFDD